MRSLAVLLSISGILADTFAQDVYQRYYGDAGSDIAYDVKATNSGGFIFAGASNSDGMLMLTDADGDTLWFNRYGGPGNDALQSVVQTMDGGFMAAGYYDEDLFALKVDDNGAQEWSQSFGFGGEDAAFGLVATEDGGALLVGQLRSALTSLCMIRLDQSGDTLWTRTLESTASLGAVDVCGSASGGFMIIGAIGTDLLVVEITAVGDVLWMRNYGGLVAGSTQEDGTSIAPVEDGGYIIGANTIGWSGGEAHLLKIDGLGDVQWTKSYGGAYQEYVHDVLAVAEGGYVLAGSAMSTTMGSNYMAYVVRTDMIGDTLWTRTYGYGTNQAFFAVESSPDGGFLFVGYATTNDPEQLDLYSVRTDAMGHSGCSEYPSSTLVAGSPPTSGNIVPSIHGGLNVLEINDPLMRGTTLGVVCTTTTVPEAGDVGGGSLVYPLPSEGVVNFRAPSGPVPLRAEVTNALGEVVHVQFLAPAIEYRLNLADLPSGSYVLHLYYKESRTGTPLFLRRD